MKTSHLLIDLENVQPENLSLLKGRHFKVKVFLGTNQSKLQRAMVLEMQALGESAEYVEIEGRGKNALDFHIAYYLGRLSAENPKADFHVISGDKGFDPLISHLVRQRITYRR
jgi:PIN domain